MAREDGSLTGGGILRSGPNKSEQRVIRKLVAQGASLKELRARFPDIAPTALEAWERSLKEAPAGTDEDPEPAAGAEKTEGATAQASAEPPAAKPSKQRKGKAQ